MFRVKFYVQGDRNVNAQIQERMRVKLTALLKHQGMTLHHIDDKGFEYYTQTHKARKPPKVSAYQPGDRVTGPRLFKGCQWYFKGPRRILHRWRGDNQPIRMNRPCTLPGTTFISDRQAYCDLHGDKALRRAAYEAKKDSVV